MFNKRLLISFLFAFIIVFVRSNYSTAIASPAFSDIGSSWAYPQIRYLINQDLINGFGDGSFRPERQVTRAEFITIVNRTFKFTATSPIDFINVSPEDWYYDDISRAVAAGYLPVYKNGNIEASKPIPRQEAAYIMSKVLKLGTSNHTSSFWDESKISPYYREAVKSMSEAQYMNGYPDGSFRPLNLISRSEAVTIICNSLKVQLSDIGYDVRDFGAKGDGLTDDTSAIQKALDQVQARFNENVFIPDGVYLINPDIAIRLHSDTKLKLSDKAVLKAKDTTKANHAIINIINAYNVQLSGGSIVGDRISRSGKTGEWGHGIKVIGSRNIRISDISISDCWGDGIYIGSTQLQNFCENVVIERFSINNCRRNGLTVISGKNVRIGEGLIAGTRGTDPQAGLCLEPNETSEFMQNILIENLTTKNNLGYGILFGFVRYANSPNAISITINNYKDFSSAKGGLSSYYNYNRPAYNLRITVNNKSN